MPSSDDENGESKITNNHIGFEGLSDQEADKISYWADWAELNAVAPPQPPRPPPNFNYQYPSNSTDTDSPSDRRKAKL